ncbi:MAG: MerR family transcriptional regulator [Burkholderiaceae bacterium]|jgi:DNA-binding transcriptional MerR regulator|nr:MerR family transcriptional regulator [Burkholderiaceae bacterium]
MKIGELARLTGLAPSRIRFYERTGLLGPAARQANGYRHYGGDAVLALRLITAGQAAGFSLQELRDLLPTGAGGATAWQHGGVLKSLQRKVAEIEARQAQLARNRGQLLDLMARIEARPEGMDCSANARRVMAGLGLAQDDGMQPGRRPARSAG